MSNSLITIDFLNKKVQPYFIENKNYTDQSSIRSLIIDLKEICSKLNHSLQKLKPENFDPQIQIPSSSSITFKWAYLEQKKLTIKLIGASCPYNTNLPASNVTTLRSSEKLMCRLITSAIGVDSASSVGK